MALQNAGKIQIVGIIQEQHAERCRLFKQWQQFDWPIVVDSLNLYGLPGIPIAMAVDEHGVIRSSNLKPGAMLETFLKTNYDAPTKKITARDYRKALKEPMPLAKSASVADLMSAANGQFLFGKAKGIDKAIQLFRAVLQREPKNAVAAFRLGVSLRRRLDSGLGELSDFEEASKSWSRALELNPGQYIWRRRIQQFGPRLEKPYNFYRWVAEARSALRKRGEKPVAFTVPLTKSEVMQKSDKIEVLSHKNPDPKSMVPNDKSHLVSLVRAVVPALSKPGRTVHLHVLLAPSRKQQSHWDADAGPIKLWLDGDTGWHRPGALAHSFKILGSKSARSVEMEIPIPKTAEEGTHTLKGFVLYPVCEDTQGTCQFLRQEFSVTVEVQLPK